MPVYRKGKQVAWVNANFHAQAFMEGLLGKGDGALSFEVFDGADNDPHSLLYATAGLTADEASGFPWTAGRGGFEVVRTLQMPDRLWTARFRSKPGFATFTERLMPWLVGFAGLMSSLFLYLIARSEEHTSELQSLMRISYA